MMNEGGVALGVAAPVGDMAGKYLTFKLEREVYGIGILVVQEIIGMLPVTRVPRTADFVRGVINLRGRVIPVIDLRRKFAMDSKEDTEVTCIIVVQLHLANNLLTMGLIVDEVSEVVNITAGQIQPPPEFGAETNTEFLLGMGRLGDRVVMLLDVEKVLTSQELAAVSTTAEQ
jgi:purine-binding chemotaxis protein CheW